MDIQTIDTLTAAYATARSALADEVARLQEELEAAKRKRLAAIRARVKAVADRHAELSAALEDASELFKKPRTRTLHGVKVGYQKQPGKVVIDDEEAVIKRIRAQLPEAQADLLIRTRESVDKNAVADLSVADLKRLGIRVTDDSDAIVIKPTDGEVDKLVDALLAGIENAEQERAA